MFNQYQLLIWTGFWMRASDVKCNLWINGIQFCSLYWIILKKIYLYQYVLPCVLTVWKLYGVEHEFQKALWPLWYFTPCILNYLFVQGLRLVLEWKLVVEYLFIVRLQQLINSFHSVTEATLHFYQKCPCNNGNSLVPIYVSIFRGLAWGVSLCEVWIFCVRGIKEWWKGVTIHPVFIVHV